MDPRTKESYTTPGNLQHDIDNTMSIERRCLAPARRRMQKMDIVFVKHPAGAMDELSERIW